MKGLLRQGGETSAVRVAMFICIITGCAVGVIGLYKGSDLLTLSGLVATYLTAGIGGKVAQKFKEGGD
ncbi:MAG: hypothetical protein ACYTFK_13970 [Planctomycetota bacterium]|jgi:hypothetical protein